ncbi:hypothetical protein K493DRAFT_333348 [Basidiobolus meristosporus CBS 931.73]|uniref:Mitochondrial potassium channel ATP-binding subunit n=1 Tax=Basidiobolus meristosporus CBS 931.73 TaxID=1314790 RepID=A0A1Y1Z6X0_9FUNG|nr:hypothetical protein K493DRAFT_333348 [Basidiobolus meristosporus CBS 931.73]|eukprot:ORY06001.1 hypothetical protein K493DRAFT_333348 [Basidiobolus meristosporus CBS 931.73]
MIVPLRLCGAIRPFPQQGFQHLALLPKRSLSTRIPALTKWNWSQVRETRLNSRKWTGLATATSILPTLKYLSLPAGYFAYRLSTSHVRCDNLIPITDSRLRILHEQSLSRVKATQKIQQAKLTGGALTQEIWTLLKKDKLLLIAVIVTAMGAAFVSLLTPLITGDLINVISKSLANLGSAEGVNHLVAELNIPALKLFGLFTAQGVLTFAHIFFVSVLGENLAKRLKENLFQAIISHDIYFFDHHRSGELIERLTTDISDFKHTFKMCITQGLKSITQTVGSAIHLIKISPSLTLIMCSTMPVMYILLNFYGAFLRDLRKKSRIWEGLSSGIAGESISNIRTVRAFAAEEAEMELYNQACEHVAAMNSQFGFHMGLFRGTTIASIGTMVLIVLYYGGSMVARNEISAGDLMTYMISTQNAQRALDSLGGLFGQTLKAMSSASRVFEFIHMEPTTPLTGGLKPDSVNGSIEFRDIYFTYPTRPDHVILENFNLTIPVGKMVALCGPSGSGKSTVGALLERFYEPQEGNIYLDGTPISELDPSWIREHVGYINQEPILFATSIFENIRYGKPDATMEEVKEAAEKANAAMFIESFPHGYDTVLGERGVTLSGGQKQRIAIARAILKDPKVLILDEATSALDTHSEKIVQDALEKLMKDRTVLVIAHRLTTIQSAGRNGQAGQARSQQYHRDGHSRGADEKARKILSTVQSACRGIVSDQHGLCEFSMGKMFRSIYQ